MTTPTTPSLPAEEWMTRAEVADYFRVSQMTVQRWEASGRLPGFKIADSVVRYRVPDVRNLIKPSSLTEAEHI